MGKSVHQASLSVSDDYSSPAKHLLEVSKGQFVLERQQAAVMLSCLSQVSSWNDVLGYLRELSESVFIHGVTHQRGWMPSGPPHNFIGQSFKRSAVHSAKLPLQCIPRQ
jgi:hypothetical protein